MTMPLTQHFVRPTDFEGFLEEIGLGLLSQEDKDRTAQMARELAAYSIVNKIRYSLTPDQQLEFGQLMTQAETSGDHSQVNNFLLKHVSNAEAIADEAIDEVKDIMRSVMAKMPERVERHLQELEKELATRQKGLGNGTPLPETDTIIPKIESIDNTTASDSSSIRLDTKEPIIPTQPPTTSLVSQEESESKIDGKFEDIQSPSAQSSAPTESFSQETTPQPEGGQKDNDTNDAYAPFPWEKDDNKEEKWQQPVISNDDSNSSQPAATQNYSVTPPAQPDDSSSEKGIREELDALDQQKTE